jgi:hypothetical protein
MPRKTNRKINKKRANRKTKRGGCGCGGFKPADVSNKVGNLAEFQGGGSTFAPSFSGLPESKYYGLADVTGDVSRLGANSNAIYPSLFKGGKSRRANKRKNRKTRSKQTRSKQTKGGGVFEYIAESVNGTGMMANPIMGSGTSAGAMYTLGKINGSPLVNATGR